MESDFLRTKDRDKIRAWITEHGGSPVIAADAENQMILYIAFKGEPGKVTRLSWEEFFDWFDDVEAIFEYAEDVLPGEEQFSYNFISDDSEDDAEDDESELADDNDLGEENMHDQL